MTRLKPYTLTPPKARSLYEQLRDDIRHKEYLPGEKLPSRREMARLQSVSVITITAAYDQLEAEGYLIARPKSGYYVCALSSYQTPSEKAFSLELLEEEPLSARGDDSFPVALWFKTMRQVMSTDSRRMMEKSPAKGCAKLRNAIARYLHRTRGMEVQPAQIIIGSGSEGLYQTLIQMFSRNMVMAIESPGYQQIEAVYQAAGVTVEKLPLEKEGISSAALEQSRAQFLHISPFYSFPARISASARKRHEYLEWIAGREGYIIEDDFNSEFFQSGRPLETLFSMDLQQKVIYLNTFSQSLSPSLRLGYMILPFPLLSLYEEKAGMFSNTVPLIEQYTLAAFIENGSFERVINRKRRNQKQV